VRTVLRPGTFPWVAPAPAGKTLATTTTTGLAVWDVAGRRGRHPFGRPLTAVRALAFAPDGRTLLTASTEPPGVVEKREAYGALGVGTEVCYRAWTTGAVADLRFWDPASGKEQPALPGQQTLGAYALALAPDGRTLVSAGMGGSLWLWDLAGRRAAGRLFVNPQAEQDWRVWETGKNSPWGVVPSLPQEVRSLAVSPDGRWLVAAGSGAEVARWDLSAGRPERQPLPGKHITFALGFSPSGRTLALGQGGDVELWDVATWTLRRTLTGHRGLLLALAFAPDGRRLASGGADGRVLLWDPGAGRQTAALAAHTPSVGGVAFTPDGKTLASGGQDGKVRLWNVRTGQELATLEGHRGSVLAVAFSPDGQTLASGGASDNHAGEVYLWQARPR
jgi:WD40 repeat protein